MSNDSLVLKIVEHDQYSEEQYSEEIHRVYVFYDHNLHTFGIRGGYATSKGTETSYSFYADNCCGVLSLMNLLATRFFKLSLCLVKFSDLPPVSNDISFDLLKNADRRIDEIVGFDYGDKQNPMDDIHKFLTVLMQVYNDY